MNLYTESYYKRYKNFDYNRLADFIMKDFEPSSLIIDIGCGIGRMAHKLKPRSKAVVGMDISFDAVKIADSHDSGVFFITGDALALPVKDKMCDICLCAHVIEHVKDFGLLLKEICRITADGGRVIFITPNKKWSRFSLPFLKDKTHVKEFTISELKKAISVYFSVEEIKSVSMFTSFGFLNPVLNAFFKPDIYVSAVKRSDTISQALAGFRKDARTPQRGVLRSAPILARPLSGWV